MSFHPILGVVLLMIFDFGFKGPGSGMTQLFYLINSEKY